jgi:hypothetical protein
VRRLRISLLSGLAGIALVTTGVGVTASAASTSTPPPVSFNTPGSTTWKVPPGVTRVRITATGAKGSDTPVQSFFRSAGGPGSRVGGTFDVTPGTTLHVNVGVGGGTSQFGGDGGGAADVRATPFGLADRLIVAAGGGGAGADSSQCGTPGTGGRGGGAGAPGPAQHSQCSPGGSGGAGATPTAGGAGGDAFYVITHHSGDGAFGVGGTAIGDDAANAVGGGGGGGWYGGGAGGGLYQAFAGSGGGGGGGSNHLHAAARDTTVSDGVNTGGASVTIAPLAGATVHFTTTYDRRDAELLHRLAARTHHTDEVAQHEATVSFARLIDWFVTRNANAASNINFNDNHEDRNNARGAIKVTSAYTVDEAATVTKVSRLLRQSESTFQRVAVLMISLTSHDH